MFYVVDKAVFMYQTENGLHNVIVFVHQTRDEGLKYPCNDQKGFLIHPTIYIILRL